MIGKRVIRGVHGNLLRLPCSSPAKIPYPYPAAHFRSLTEAESQKSKTKNLGLKTQNCSSVRRFAIYQKRDLQLQDMAILAEAKSDQLYAADIARFPIGSLDRLIRLVGS